VLSRYRRAFIATAVYAALAVLAYWNLWTSPHPATQQLSGSDAGQNVWFLSYWAWALIHGPPTLSTSVANSPYGVNLMDNTSLAFPAILVAPSRCSPGR
jgi:hypothetical protein